MTTEVTQLRAAVERVGILDGSLDDPQFDRAGRVHDWRNYVSPEVQAVWPQLNDVARMAVYLTAFTFALAEDWE